MSVTFTNQKIFETTRNTIVCDGQNQATIAFKCRTDNLAAASNWSYVVSREGLNTFYFTLLGTATHGVNTVQAVIANGTQGVYDNFSISAGAVVHVCLTYDQGSQVAWINGVPTTIGVLNGPTKSNNVMFMIGGSPATPPVVYTLDDIAIWNGYVATPTEIRGLRDGILTPRDIGATATWRGRWTLAGTAGATPQVGDPGLINDFGDITTNLTTITGTGSAVYSDSLVWIPATKTKEAHIGSSGETLFIYFSSITSNTDAMATAEIIRPSLLVNGVDVGTLGAPWISGHHNCIRYLPPSGVTISPSDIVTLSTASGWMNTTLGLAREETIPVLNYSGRGVYSSKITNPTLRIGFNHPHPPDSAGIYQTPRNLIYRSDVFRNSTLDSGGKPIAMSVNPVASVICTNSQSNLIDSTMMPGPIGLHAVGWDDLNPSDPTLFYIFASNANTTVTERVDLRNTGTGGLNQVRVFDVQLSGANSTVNTSISLGMSNASKTPRFANLVVYGPNDFTPVAPIVLDKSNPYELSSRYKSWSKNSPGSMRFVDSTWLYDGATTASEPSDMRDLTDFSWGNGLYKRAGAAGTIGYTEARPFALPGYVYSKHFGSPFAATLAADIDDTTTILNISDTATAPIFIGLQLTIDSEKMEVTNVSGTTVTVDRGTSSTVATAHSAGQISVNNRFLITSYDQLALSNSGLIAEFVASAPHAFRTGNFVSWFGTWPTMTWTDGTTQNVSGDGRIIFVTGPNTYVWSSFNSVAAPVTLSTTYALNPVNQYTEYVVPETASFPVEFTALDAGSHPDCDIHINVPMAASDSMVDEIARRVRDNFPSGRKVWVELSNETWRNYKAITWFNTVTNFLYPSGPSRGYFIQRIGEVCQRFRDRFNEKGVNRGEEIKSLLGVAQADTSDANAMINAAITLGVKIDGLAAACYIGCDDITPASVTAYSNSDIPQAIDLWIHDFAESTNGFLAGRRVMNSYIANYNAVTGNSCVLYAYEGGVQSPMPAGVTNYMDKIRDMMYHPNWYFAEQDTYANFQNIGYKRFNLYGIGIAYVTNTIWGVYHYPQQDYGRGDGSDGKADNRHCLAEPGRPYSKASTTNQDLQNVSVRGQALLDWNAAPIQKDRARAYKKFRSSIR